MHRLPAPPTTGIGMLQVWHTTVTGTTASTATLAAPAALLGIVHDSDGVVAAEWAPPGVLAPPGGWVASPAIGLLAAAFYDGAVRVYRVPRPASLPAAAAAAAADPPASPALIRLVPAAVALRRGKVPTCLRWSPVGGAADGVLVVGYTDGSTAVFRVPPPTATPGAASPQPAAEVLGFTYAGGGAGAAALPAPALLAPTAVFVTADVAAHPAAYQAVRGVAVNPAAPSQVAVVTYHGAVRLWDMAAPAVPVLTLPCGVAVRFATACDFVPDGSAIVVSTATGRLVSLQVSAAAPTTTLCDIMAPFPGLPLWDARILPVPERDPAAAATCGDGSAFLLPAIPRRVGPTQAGAPPPLAERAGPLATFGHGAIDTRDRAVMLTPPLPPMSLYAGSGGSGADDDWAGAPGATYLPSLAATRARIAALPPPFPPGTVVAAVASAGGTLSARILDTVAEFDAGYNGRVRAYKAEKQQAATLDLTLAAAAAGAGTGAGAAGAARAAPLPAPAMAAAFADGTSGPLLAGVRQRRSSANAAAAAARGRGTGGRRRGGVGGGGSGGGGGGGTPAAAAAAGGGAKRQQRRRRRDSDDDDDDESSADDADTTTDEEEEGAGESDDDDGGDVSGDGDGGEVVVEGGAADTVGL